MMLTEAFISIIVGRDFLRISRYPSVRRESQELLSAETGRTNYELGTFSSLQSGRQPCGVETGS